MSSTSRPTDDVLGALRLAGPRTGAPSRFGDDWVRPRPSRQALRRDAVVGVALVALAAMAHELSRSAGLWFVVFYVLGFAALTSPPAVAGSVATRQEDLQSTTTPAQTVVMGAMFVGRFASGNVLTVASFVPLWQPVVLSSETAPRTGG